jgi:hypothetical protein
MAEITKYFARLSKIFLEQEWIVKFKEAGYDDTLNNFLEMIGELSNDEADLILTLTEDYLYIDANAISRCFREIYLSISVELISSYKEVYILPLREPDGGLNTKSSSFVIYPACHILRSMCPGNGTIGNVKIESFDSMAALDSELSGRGNCLIIFVDDFIGTGLTALKALSSYRCQFRKMTDEVAVMSAVCQEEGNKKIKNAGFDVWTHHIRKRGVSDSTKIKEVEKAIEVMLGISTKRIQISKKYHLGFLSSEALVTMPFRTPNNTFPIYWVSNATRKAPFYR